MSSIPRQLRDQVFVRDRGRCRWCGLTQLGQAATFHVDHIRPRSLGGPTSLDNLALQCPSCSIHKADKVAGLDPVSGTTVPLLHPLADPWGEHIRLETDGTCVGTTARGRATIAALGMNLPVPRFARACQLRLGLIEL